MNLWLAAATALLCSLAPLIWVIAHEAPIDGLAAVELMSPIVASILLLLCEGVSRPEYADLALALAIMSFGGSLVYARFLERWL